MHGVWTEELIRQRLDADLSARTIHSKPKPQITVGCKPEKLPEEPVKRDIIIIPPSNIDLISVKEISVMVSQATGVGVKDIYSPRRHIKTVRARMMVCYLAKKFTILSLPSIGMRLGNRDHSTVLHSIRSVANDRARFEPEISMVEAAIMTNKKAA